MLALAVSSGATKAYERARWETSREILLWIEQLKVPQDPVEMVQRAARSWQRASGGKLSFREARECPPTSVRVRFVRDDENFGEAVPYVDRHTGRIVRADVVLLLDPPGDRLHKQLVVYLSALHELGHALGLPHDEQFGSIMYQFKRRGDPERFFVGYRKKLRSTRDIGADGASGLTRADGEALKTLYGP